MYHYTESGLKSVWLVNGYQAHKTEYGRGISIEDLEGLHRAIALRLITRKNALSGAEFLFLRKELGLSQSKLASILGNNEQSVALWEKRGRIPIWADRMIRAFYREKAEGNARLMDLIEWLSDLDRENQAKWVFESHNGWDLKAA